MDIKTFFKNDRFANFSGIELLEVGNGYAKAKMTIADMHLNGGNVVQGGALFTLADLAFAAAVNSHAQLTLSIQSSIHIFKSGKSGETLYAEAKEVYSHPKLCNCEVRLTSAAGELVATFVGTAYRKNVQLPFKPIE
ncbi:MAG: PaaI family thioesterase [Bacteroidales bacterium]|jgi:acyl-CoA thioesterase|nr:PaaI family thioesterase [Bacteroidales bacterium]